MSLISQTLIHTLRQQITKHGVVVWYDPAQEYAALAAALQSEDVAGAAIFRYQASRGFLWLRHTLETQWQGETTPRLLIYVPVERAASQYALIEFEAAGIVLQPGMQPPDQNTALAVIARQALPQVFPSAAVAEMVSQVEAGQLTLAELDRQAEKGLDGQAGVINAIFGTGNAQEVALRFLSDPTLDDDIVNRQALPGLADLFSDALGLPFHAGDSSSALRAQLARHVLLTDLLQALEPDVPDALRSTPQAEQEVARAAACALAHAWRNRLDLQASYRQWAGKIQSEIGLTALHLPLVALVRVQTFAAADVGLQTAVEKTLPNDPDKALVDLAQARIGGFWAAQDPASKIRWEIIWDAGRVLWEAARVAKALKAQAGTAETLLARYAFGSEGSDPWCFLDTAQRHLERDFHRFDVNHEQHQSLVRLVAAARQQYATVAGQLASRFIHTYEQQSFDLPQVMLQADLCRELVYPAAQAGKVAYLLVDALRLEMAHELRAMLGDEWRVQLDVALATPPTVTDVGMAALMPGAEKGVSFTESGGKLLSVIAGVPLKNRADRVQQFHSAFAPQPTAETRLDQLAPLANNKLAKQLKEAAVILVTATDEIDGLCESNPSLARRMLDDVFNQLRRGLKTLFDLGVQTVILTADHGYLFGEEISAGDSLDAPGGQTALLKRRVWVGKGGANLNHTLRRPLTAFGIHTDLEIVTPYNLACFKVAGGGLAYFHGGLSLPEIAIPVLKVQAGTAVTPTPGAIMRWSLTLGSKQITTRFVTVTIGGQSSELLPVQPPRGRVELQAGGQAISVPVAASYGFQESTKDVQLQLHPDDARAILPNTVTLLITEEVTATAVSVHLLDAATGVTLSRLDNVPVEIII